MADAATINHIFGTLSGQSLKANKWITDIYMKENNKWFCVMINLTQVKESIDKW
jgi:hypothetical protein